MFAPTLDLARVLAGLNGQPWLIEPSAHGAMLDALAHISGQEMAGVVENLMRQRVDEQAMRVDGGIAQIPVLGPLMRNPGIIERLILGASDTSTIADNIAAATRRQDVSGILLMIDSPGGQVSPTKTGRAALRHAPY